MANESLPSDVLFPYRCPACNELLKTNSGVMVTPKEIGTRVNPHGIVFGNDGRRELHISFVCKCKASGNIRVEWHDPSRQWHDESLEFLMEQIPWPFTPVLWQLDHESLFHLRDRNFPSAQMVA